MNAPLFADLPGDIRASFEFFPPKSEKMEAQLWEAITQLAPLGPRFVSVTYGAGGSTRERTHATVARLVRETALTPAAHLTCVGASKDEILREIILPAALPDILSGCRTALAFSFILMVSSEFVIAKDGLGFLIGSLGDGGNYPAMFAVILSVAGTGFVADRLFGSFASHRLRWKEQA